MLRIGPNIQSIINAEIITASPSHFVGHYTVLIYPLAFFFAKELLIKSQVHFKNGCISVQKKNQKNNKKKTSRSPKGPVKARGSENRKDLRSFNPVPWIFYEDGGACPGAHSY